METRMHIMEDQRASDIFEAVFDKTPDGTISMPRDADIMREAFNQLRALGYSKEDCNDFLNDNLSCCDDA